MFNQEQEPEIFSHTENGIAKQLVIPPTGQRRESLELTVSQRVLPQGRVNDTTVYFDKNGTEYVWKTRKNTELAMQRRQAELSRLGYFELGGQIAIRTIEEEAAFIDLASRNDLKIMSYLFWSPAGILLPFHSGKDLRNLLEERHFTPVLGALADIMEAHQKNITYGDRWPQNILTDGQNSIIHIDFDIEISGKSAAELEIAQLLFGLIRDAKYKTDLLGLLREVIPQYDWSAYHMPHILQFISQYVSGYQISPQRNGHQVEQLHKTAAEVLSLLQRQ